MVVGPVPDPDPEFELEPEPEPAVVLDDAAASLLDAVLDMSDADELEEVILLLLEVSELLLDDMGGMVLDEVRIVDVELPITIVRGADKVDVMVLFVCMVEVLVTTLAVEFEAEAVLDWAEEELFENVVCVEAVFVDDDVDVEPICIVSVVAPIVISALPTVRTVGTFATVSAATSVVPS